MAKSSSISRIVVLVLLLAAGATGTWYYLTQSKDKDPEYATVPVNRGDVIQVVTATGGLQAVTTVDVSSQISGLVKSRAVDFNTPVKVGQVLAQLDPATYESRLAAAEAQLANTRANFNLVRINTERTRQLQKQNLVPQQDLDQAEAQLAQAEAQMKIQQAAVDNAKVDLARCTIYAPIDGIVIDRVTEVGKTVSASTSAPTLFTIVNDLSKMQISAAVAEADIGTVENGQTVNFTVDAYPNRQFRGRISQIRNAPKTANNVVTYETIIDVSNDDLKLKPGMTANVSIVIARRDGVLRVANAALRVRIPDNLLPAAPKVAEKADAKAGAPAPVAPKPVTEEERRKAMGEIMREAGFVRGNGPPTPDVVAKMQQLAKDRGIEMDFGRFGGRGGDRAAAPGVPVTRTAYKLVGSDPKTRHPEATTLKLGISDGITTEIIEGATEGDLLITSVTMPGTAGAPSAPGAGANPFTGGNRGFGGGGRR